jgi:dTDP-4-dehydrorhamnose reductase
MLASALISKLSGHEVVKLDLPGCDITDYQQVIDNLKERSIDFVYHIAAYTNVDKAEEDSEQAFLVNEKGTANIAQICAAESISVLYISTDYVFGSGEANGTHPWQEGDPVAPQGIYARSKLAGEEVIRKTCEKYFIVRTAWLYGPNGKNFVDTMLKLAQEHDKLKVVSDQTGSPTYTEDLAKGLVQFLDIHEYGIYHLTNQGNTTWYDFAKKIFELSKIEIEVTPCTTNEFPRPAKRPKYSVLANEKWRKIGKKELPAWEEGLKDYLSHNY